MSGGAAGAHKSQGIGAGFVPRNCDMSLVDEVLAVAHEIISISNARKAHIK